MDKLPKFIKITTETYLKVSDYLPDKKVEIEDMEDLDFILSDNIYTHHYDELVETIVSDLTWEYV